MCLGACKRETREGSEKYVWTSEKATATTRVRLCNKETEKGEGKRVG